MNILILNWRDPKHPLAGGAEKMLLQHVTYWRERRAKITWIASSFPHAKKEETLDGITIKRMGSHYSVHLKVWQLALENKLSEFDIVVDCFHFLPFFSPLLFRRKKVIALIHEVAGKVWFENLLLPFALIGYLLEPLFFLLYRNTPFVTVSDSTKKELISLGIPENHISIIHNGVHLPTKTPLVKKTSFPSVLFLNRISTDKGFVDAVEAFRLVKEKVPSAHFFIAGKEEKKGAVEKVLKEFQLQDVEYLGYVSEKEKWDLYKKSWLLMHPSKKEGWGLTVIEANSMSTPVVGYSVEGLKDSIMHNKTGILCQPNYEDLATQISLLLKNTKKLQKLSKNAKEWASTFSWKKSTQESWEVLTK